MGRREAARRNVHQQYAVGQLLTVDWSAAAPRESPMPMDTDQLQKALGQQRDRPLPAKKDSDYASATGGAGILAWAMEERPSNNQEETGDDGVDIDAEIAAVAAEAAELEEQLAIASAIEATAAAAAAAAGGQGLCQYCCAAAEEETHP